MVLRGKGFMALVVVTALVVVAASTTLERAAPRPQVGELVFPALLDDVNAIARVDVTSGGETFALERDGAAWKAPSRGGYPLEPDKVHQLLVGAAGLERLEPKTSDPARFEELGLREPDSDEARSVRFVLRDAGGGARASLLVGERRPAKGDPTRTEYFVRVPGEERSWLVRGTLPDDAGDVVDWLDKRIVAISGDRIARTRVTHADGEVVTIVKRTPDDVTSFDYLELPEGSTVSESWRVNDLGRVLVDLSLDDVQPKDAASLPAESLRAVVETYDGLRVTVRLFGTGERPPATLEAAFDASLRSGDGERPAQLRPEDAVREEAARLNARWAPWAYTPPKWKSDALRYRRADLVETADTGSQGAGQGAGQRGSEGGGATPPPG